MSLASPDVRTAARIIATCLLAVAATPTTADWVKEAAPSNREAVRFFAEFLEDRSLPIETCAIESEWSRIPIPYDLAHEFLGLDVRADLQNLSGADRPAQVLVAAGVAKDAICDDKAREHYTRDRVEAWQRDFKALAGGARPKSDGFYIYRCAYSFPAFDETFTRAIAVEECDAFPYFFDEKGARKRGDATGGVVADTYRRDEKGWHKVRRVGYAKWG